MLVLYYAGLQKVDGIVGALVARQPKMDDPNSGLYDFDLPSHVVTIQDWYHLMADAMFPGLRFRDKEQMAASYLIQGRGQFIMVSIKYAGLFTVDTQNKCGLKGRKFAATRSSTASLHDTPILPIFSSK